MVEPPVELEDECIQVVANDSQPFRVKHDCVVQVAMHHQKFPPVGHGVNGFVADVDTAEGESDELPRTFIVISGDIGDPCPLAGLAQNLLNDVVVGLSPIPPAFQLPTVDDVPNKEKTIALVMLEKVEKPFGLATGGSQMNIRYPDRAVMMNAYCRVFVEVQGTVPCVYIGAYEATAR